MSLMRECTPGSSCPQTMRAGVKNKNKKKHLWVQREIKKAFVAFGVSQTAWFICPEKAAVPGTAGAGVLALIGTPGAPSAPGAPA